MKLGYNPLHQLSMECKVNFQSKQFGFNKVDNIFHAEVSELTEGGKVPLWNRATRCLSITSHRTGVTESFRLKSVEVDDDNDIKWWEFAPVNESNPITVRVFND